MKLLKKQGLNFLVWVILAGMILIRLTSYGDFKLSVAIGDTESYIQGGSTQLFIKDLFTKNRLFTTNLLYYLANVQGCKIQAISYPAVGTEMYRAHQSCFDKIAVVQNIISVIA
jgi:hypothetical protein